MPRSLMNDSELDFHCRAALWLCQGVKQEFILLLSSSCSPVQDPVPHSWTAVPELVAGTSAGPSLVAAGVGLAFLTATKPGSFFSLP